MGLDYHRGSWTTLYTRYFRGLYHCFSFFFLGLSIGVGGASFICLESYRILFVYHLKRGHEHSTFLLRLMKNKCIDIECILLARQQTQQSITM